MDELATDRLRLRRWTDADTDFLFDMYSRWEVQRFLGPQPRVMASRDEVAPLLERWATMANGVQGVWAITGKQDERRHGTALLKPIPASGTWEPTGDIDVGWHLHPDSWGHGYATEAAKALVTAGFSSSIPRILAVTYPDNLASQAVCARLGMTHVGLTDEYYSVTCELFEILPRARPGQADAGG